MAQHYDMAARKNFAERAFRGDDEFDVDVASKSLDEDILKCAEDHYDMLSAKKLAGRRVVKPAALRATPRTPPVDDFHKSKVRSLCCACVCEVRSCNLVCCQANAGKNCSFCGKPGHTEETCFVKHGKPPKNKNKHFEKDNSQHKRQKWS